MDALMQAVETQLVSLAAQKADSVSTRLRGDVRLLVRKHDYRGVLVTDAQIDALLAPLDAIIRAKEREVLVNAMVDSVVKEVGL